MPSVTASNSSIMSLLCNPKHIVIYGCDGGITEDFSESQKKYCHYKCCKQPAVGYREKLKTGDGAVLDIKIGWCEYIRDPHQRWGKKHRKRWEKSYSEELPYFESMGFPVKHIPVYIVGLHSRYSFGKRITLEDSLKLI